MRIRRSKTDQEGKGHTIGIPFAHDPILCPVRAVRDWRQLADIGSGPLFRPIGKGGTVSANRLTDRSISEIVKRLAENAGYDSRRFSGHSLRAGFCTAAAAAGIAERLIARHSRHESLVILRGYIREGSIWVDNPASTLL